MTTTAAPAVGREKPAPTSLPEEFRFFRSSINARLEFTAVVALLLARVFTGPLSGNDAIIVAVLVAVQPFFEWSFHIYVLHYRPVRVFGRVVDFEFARKHREHHADPSSVELVFVPLRSLLLIMVGTLALTLALFPTVSGALTLLAGAAMLLLAYEWTHYLIHSSYRPKSRLFRAIWRAHRLHHFKNEQYWFGVTSPAADYVLRTFPDAATVPTSLTARDLDAR